jgi:Leucine-rich repeat (LRR) protein
MLLEAIRLLVVVVVGIVFCVTTPLTLACLGNISTEAYDILESLYDSTAGREWNWDARLPSTTVWQFPCNRSTPCSDQWQGLVCAWNLEQTMCIIESVTLNGYNLRGTIPGCIGNLTSLVQLSLSNNSLSQSISSELGNLVELEDFYLDNNVLAGSIPSQLGRLKNMLSLNLSTNLLTSGIPSELGELKSIKNLYAFSNFLEGAIPSELGNLVELDLLDLSSNILGSTIPAKLFAVVTGELILNDNYLEGEMQSTPDAGMAELILSDNLLSGTIPSEFGTEMTFLEVLLVDGNLLEGSIPATFGDMVFLFLLDLSSNLLEGSIPSQLTYHDMFALLLSDNMLEGSIPIQLGSARFLITLDLSNNFLESTLASEMGFCSTLSGLDLSSNLLENTVPSQIANLTNMMFLDLSDNMFTGALPSVESWQLLEVLNVSQNRLSGPAVIADSLAALLVLDLSKNHFTGSIAASLFMHASLQTVILSENCFSGTLPESICFSDGLENIVLDLLTGNCKNTKVDLPGFILPYYLHGTIPSCIWNSSSIQVLHLIGNGLNGGVMDLANNSRLSILALGSNQLTGSIPRTFQTHDFDQLDLSINRLSGTLEPDLFVNTRVSVFDLSVNRLSGDIPVALDSPFTNSTINVLMGNLFGCQQNKIASSGISDASYQCGSLDFQYSLIAWLVVVGIVIVSTTFVALSRIDSVHSFIDIFKEPSFLSALVGPIYVLIICGLGLVGYSVAKLTDLSTAASTHTVQYWWSSTIAFLHGWAISVFLCLLLVTSCTVFVAAIVSLSGLQDSTGNANLGIQCVPRLVRLVWPSIAHVVNIVVVIAINAIYILLVVDNLEGVQVIVIQAALGLFKLAWSLSAIPWMMSHITNHLHFPLVHWIFMVLFVFLGAPFTSTFCESSSCFLYVLTNPRSISFSFSILSINLVLGSDVGAIFLFQSTTYETLENTISSPWIYSFQCSSAIVTLYAPVLVLSYLASGVIVPLASIMGSKWGPLGSWNVLTFWRQEMDFNDSVPDKMLLQHRFVTSVATRMLVKYVVNFTVMLTFGLAVPTLAAAVLCDTIINIGSSLFLLEQNVQRSYAETMITCKVRQEFWKSFRLSQREEASSCCYIVLGYVGIFWSLFMFDWMGDVYGSLTGGLMMLIPLVLPTVLGVILLKRAQPRQQHVISRQISNSIEINEIRYPVIRPQSTNDDFNAASVGGSDECSP